MSASLIATRALTESSSRNIFAGGELLRQAASRPRGNAAVQSTTRSSGLLGIARRARERDGDREERPERRLLLDFSGFRRRPRGVAKMEGMGADPAVRRARAEPKVAFGVGGEGRAIVLHEEEEMGDSLISFVDDGDTICSSEK
jgi:MoxR-like ATPase